MLLQSQSDWMVASVPFFYTDANAGKSLLFFLHTNWSESGFKLVFLILTCLHILYQNDLQSKRKFLVLLVINTLWTFLSRKRCDKKVKTLETCFCACRLNKDTFSYFPHASITYFMFWNGTKNKFYLKNLTSESLNKIHSSFHFYSLPCNVCN